MAMTSLIRKISIKSPRPRVIFPLVIKLSHNAATVNSNPKFEIKSAWDSFIDVSALDSYMDVKFPEPPSGFPFKIEDIPGEDIIKLRRKLGGEKITVEASRPIIHNDKEFNYTFTEINLNLKVSKSNGRFLDVRFTVDEDSIDEESIDTDCVAFEDQPNPTLKQDPALFGPTSLWMEFIRARGIEDSIGQFLIQYMTKRKERDRLLFLKKFRKFVE